MDVAVRAANIEPRQQLPGAGDLRGVARADQDVIGAVFGHRHETLAGIAAGGAGADHATGATGAVTEKPIQGRCQIDRRGMHDRNHHHVALRPVDPLDDAGQTGDIVRIVGDDQRVVVCVDRNGVIGSDQRPENRHQLQGRLVLQHKNLRDQPVTPGLVRLPAGRRLPFGKHHFDRRTMKLGVRLRQDRRHPVRLDGRKTLQAQCRQQHLVSQLARHWRGGNDIQRSLDTRVDQEISPGKDADGLDDLIDIRIDEVQRHEVACIGAHLGGRRRRRGRLRQ